jgi:hypothetical protein
MEDQSRISLAPRTLASLWLGAVPPFAAGLASGGLAAALGTAFAAACPLLVASSARWPVRAPRFFPLYFVALFLVALAAFDLNSAAFVVDTWSALLLGLLTMPAGRPQKIEMGAVADAPTARRHAAAPPWPGPRLVGFGPRTGE